jgi:GNAT superfamily N-acetyltransferase
MKMIEQWQEGKDEYLLNDGFVLKRADKLEFGIHETIYLNVDLELSYSWKKQTIDKIGFDDHFWIYKDRRRIGGVHMSPNLMGAFFMETPYYISKFVVIDVLLNALQQWAGKNDTIKVYGVIPEDIEYYQKNGYKIKCERRVMIRPTEVFEDINWVDNFTIRIPTIADSNIIGKLFFEGYSNGIDYEVFGEKSLSEAIMDAEKILNIYQSNGNLDGSTLVFDKNTIELVAACIAGISGFCDNDFSEIGEIVVKPDYRKLGLAFNMIKSTLTSLKEISPATILCVTIGNPAERLYYRAGFFPGVKFTNMYLKK